jgi:hypothetical protein
MAGLAAGADAACARSSQDDVCADVDCSSRGFCVADQGMPYCTCLHGFHPVRLECLPNDVADPCAGIVCSGHGACSAEGAEVTCLCDPGYGHMLVEGAPCADVECDLYCFPRPGEDADADAPLDELGAGDADAEGSADADADSPAEAEAEADAAPEGADVPAEAEAQADEGEDGTAADDDGEGGADAAGGPVCEADPGSGSLGRWVDPASGDIYCEGAPCRGCEAVCLYDGSYSEGWYAECSDPATDGGCADGSDLIVWVDCM